jgi:UMF1 family MFS transporter
MPLIAGIGWGGFYTSNRALLIKIAPKENLGEYFGLYSTFEKFASIIGPMVWGIITLILIDNGIIKYRVAGMVVVGLMAIGIYFIYKVKE